MGNCFGKQSASDDAFAGPGRTVGSSAPPQRGNEPTDSGARASIPARSSPGRTLGGGNSEDPRAATARAAEERAAKAQGKGTLGKKLDAQRRMNTLEEASRENRLARDADTLASTRNWD